MTVMKNSFIFTTLAAASVTLGLSSCEDEFLGLEPQGSENSENYMYSAENAEYVINGCYDLLQFDEGNGPDDVNGEWSVSGHFDFMVGDMISDDSEKGSSTADNAKLLELICGKGAASNEIARAFWLHGFWGVSRCNYAIEKLGGVSWDADLRDQYMGEALFLRAYFNWYLVRYFGPVPLFTKSVQPSDFGSVQRASVHEVYAQIAADLTKAAELLPLRSEQSDSELGRATKGAAQALLARVMMYQIGTDPDNNDGAATWQKVYDLTKSVIESGEYRLLDNYAQLFETEYDNNAESVFDVQFGDGSSDSAPECIGTNFYQYQSNRETGAGWGFNNPSSDLYREFEAGDPRISSTLYGATYNSGILYGEKTKFRDTSADDWSLYFSRKAALQEMPASMKAAPRNIRIIRYADVILMNAEAAANTGKEAEAISMVNKIRERANKSTMCKGFNDGAPNAFPENSVTNPLELLSSSLRGDALKEAISHERRVELAMEGLRFYDLVRTNKLAETLQSVKWDARQAGGADYNVYKEDYVSYYDGVANNIKGKSRKGALSDAQVFVLPIPSTEVSAYGLEQNPGY